MVESIRPNGVVSLTGDDLARERLAWARRKRLGRYMRRRCDAVTVDFKVADEHVPALVELREKIDARCAAIASANLSTPCLKAAA